MHSHKSSTLNNAGPLDCFETSRRQLFDAHHQPVEQSASNASRCEPGINVFDQDQSRLLLQKTCNEMIQRAKDAEAQLRAHRLLNLRADRMRSLGQMAAGIAHELNQPLVGVRGIAEHLLIGIDRGWNFSDEKLREKLSLIIAQADRMSHIITRVRMFTREAGKPEASLVQVNDVVTAAVSMLGPQLLSSGIKLNCELAETIPLIQVHPMSLEEVVLNLVANSADALTELTGNLATSTPQCILVRTQIDHDNDLVLIQVIDRGVGIPEDLLDKVFEPFLTTKGPDRGTGLGLAICKDLVEQMDGAIGIDSMVGRGTSVTVSLPVAPSLPVAQVADTQFHRGAS